MPLVPLFARLKLLQACDLMAGMHLPVETVHSVQTLKAPTPRATTVVTARVTTTSVSEVDDEKAADDVTNTNDAVDTESTAYGLSKRQKTELTTAIVCTVFGFGHRFWNNFIDACCC
jgi:hypothetical protein